MAYHHTTTCVLLGLSLATMGLGCSDRSEVDGPRGSGASHGSGTGGTGGSSTGVGGLGAGGLGVGGSGASVQLDDIELAPTRAVSFEPEEAEFPNPERGFYRYVTVTSDTNLNWVAEGGYRLVYSYVRLDSYRNGPIAESLFDDLERGLDAVRAAGLKIILRFAYNNGPWPDSEPDAPKNIVLSHIEQIAPYLEQHRDVIALVQAGFIGAWGEWHTSTNNLHSDPEARQEILEALLDAVPQPLTTALRYPAHKETMYGEPLSDEAAFAETYASRTGHHNDCFLSGEYDVGTYPENPTRMAELKAYLESDTRFVPMGGETCDLHERSACDTAQEEMARFHFSYLNLDYDTDVIDHWEDNGCLADIRRSLGYRLELLTANVPEQVRPGGAFDLEVTLKNSGYAAPFNVRPVSVVLSGAAIHRATISDLDPRRWLPDGSITFRVRVWLPTALPPGSYSLALALPDPAESLSARPEYAIRFANEATWEDGLNVLTTIQVDADAPGEARSDQADLATHLLEHDH